MSRLKLKNVSEALGRSLLTLFSTISTLERWKCV
jgi:hypothetical protein